MFTIFGIVFDMACKSDCVEFIETMKIVVDKLFDPAVQFWPTYWLSSRLRVTCSDYYVIDAVRLEHFAVNLKRIKLLEKLRVISMFTFRGTTHRETFELLIDCGSTHSFLSPRCLRKLKLGTSLIPDP